MDSICMPIDLVCEFLKNPMGLNETKPRLSWKISDERPDARQTGYQIVASKNLEDLENKPELWKTGWVKSSDCLDIEWDGKALSHLAASNIKNVFSYNVIKTGPYGLIAPESAKATVLLPSSLSHVKLSKGDYQLQVFTINGHRFLLGVRFYD